MKIKYLLSVLITAALFSGCGDDVKEEKVRLVRTLELVPTKAVSSHSFNGIARSDVAARLSFNVSGTVKKVRVHDGQYVKEGKIIAELKDSFFRLKVNEVKASLNQARVKLANAKARYKRIKKLYVNRSVSLSDLDDARTTMESAKANYNAMKNRLEEAQLKLSYTKLRAPISGTISDLRIEKGENITPAMSVASISSTKTIEVPISVPGSLISQVEEGQKCTVTFDALKKKKYKAKVVEVSHASSQRTTTFPVVVRLTTKNTRIHPGMSATVRFNFDNGKISNSFVVPLHALMEDEKGYYLYVVEDIVDGVGVIKRRNVMRGELTSNGVVITRGVMKGMHVLTAGMSRVQENQKVRVKGD